MMTKTDFEMVASIFEAQVSHTRDLRGAEVGGGLDTRASGTKATTLEVLAYNMVQKFYVSNPRFNHKTFYEACGFTIEGNYPKVFPTEG